MDEIQKLYSTLTELNLYTKSFESFLEQYKDDEYKQKVHDVIVDEGLYTGNFNKFTSDYALPVVVEEKVEETEDPVSISESITGLATDIWDGITNIYSDLTSTTVEDSKITKENFPGEYVTTDNAWLKPLYDNINSQNDRYIGKYNPKIDGIGIHDHMFKGVNEEGEIKILPEFSNIDTDKQYKRAQQYLTEAYPDYKFSFDVKELRNNTLYSLTMEAPNGNKTTLAEGAGVTSLPYKIDESELKFKVVDFIDKNGINPDFYKAQKLTKKLKNREINQAIALNSDQQKEIDEINSNNELFTTFTMPSTLTSTGKKIQPYEEELKQAEKILKEQQKDKKELTGGKLDDNILQSDIEK